MKKEDHQPGEVAAKSRSNPICPTRKILNTEPEYKYSTTPYPLGMGDSRETHERRKISWVSPM
jgi:hypothetical protein